MRGITFARHEKIRRRGQHLLRRVERRVLRAVEAALEQHVAACQQSIVKRDDLSRVRQEICVAVVHVVNQPPSVFRDDLKHIVGKHVGRAGTQPLEANAQRALFLQRRKTRQHLIQMQRHFAQSDRYRHSSSITCK